MSIWDDAPKNSRALYEYLKVLARRMRVETYGEIAAEVERTVGYRVLPRGLGVPLGFIRDEVCRSQGLPWLNALAVNAETRIPGDSFLPSDISLGESEEILWRGMVLAVFAYPWHEVRVE